MGVNMNNTLVEKIKSNTGSIFMFENMLERLQKNKKIDFENKNISDEIVKVKIIIRDLYIEKDNLFNKIKW
jgi:hypothetical protein